MLPLSAERNTEPPPADGVNHPVLEGKPNALPAAGFSEWFGDSFI
jgi:hypothetical protein